MMWKPQKGKQELALTLTDFEILYGGARYGGKSEVGRAWLLKPFLQLEKEELKKYTALVIRRSLKDLKEWLRKAALFYSPLNAKVIGGSSPEVRFPQGPVFFTGHLQDENSYMQYMGWELQRILIEELNQIPNEMRYLQVLGSCRSTIPGLDARVMCNTNPGGPGHVWIKKRFGIDGKPPYKVTRIKDEISGRTRVFIPAKAEDNPIGMKADPGYVKFLESLPGDLRPAWREGDFSVFAGQFFDLRPDVHCIEPYEIYSQWPLWGSMDYGTTNATSFSLNTKSSHDGRIIRLFTYYREGLSGPEHARGIKHAIESFPHAQGRFPDITYADPSMWTKVKTSEVMPATSPSDYFDFLNLTPANNDRVNGWRVCRDLLNIDDDGKSKFCYFDEHNEKFEELIPAQVHSKNNVDDLMKCDIDHVADEWRYGCMGVHEVDYSFLESSAKKDYTLNTRNYRTEAY